MRNKSGKVNKNRIIICTVLSAILLCVCIVYVLYPSKYQKNLAELEKTCAEFTASNADGRVYEAIVGQYLGSKSMTIAPSSNSISTVLTHKMVLSDDGVTEVYINYSSDWNDEFFDLLFKMVGENTIRKKQDTKSQYGICSYLSNYNIYVGEIKTFNKVGE